MLHIFTGIKAEWDTAAKKTPAGGKKVIYNFLKLVSHLQLLIFVYIDNHITCSEILPQSVSLPKYGEATTNGPGQQACFVFCHCDHRLLAVGTQSLSRDVM